MSNISAINTARLGRWNYFKDLASIVCSRESTYRTALDITGFDLPSLIAESFRGPKKFLEAVFEGLCATVSIGLAPIITSCVGKILARSILPKNVQNDSLDYLKFEMNELRNIENFKAGIERIKKEEPEDKNFVASLYERLGKNKKAEYYKGQAEEITRFCENFKPTEELRKQVYKLKKATIITESFIEGGFWGSFGLLLRLFRKHILREDRFTGTKGYTSDAESEQLGESGDMNLFQKIVGVGSIFLSPVMNTILLAKTEDDEAVKNSKFLNTVRNHLDMTHGVYPKLGLLFTWTSIPKWVGAIITAQGWYERVERKLKLLTVIPSWWMGHRVTNGLFAKHADKELAKKYNNDGGILVEPDYLKPITKEDSFLTRSGKRFPEPARIHHVLSSTGDNKQLQEEAEDLHAKCSYKGFAMHSLLVWAINMSVNYTSKLRVKRALGS